jgi:hypothetical protein
MESPLARSTSLYKDEVQQTRGPGSGIGDQGSGGKAQCNAMESQLCRRASLPKDAVQRSAPVPPAGRQARGAETARFSSSPHA